MDHVTLKKKLGTYRTEGGFLKNVSDDLLCDLLSTWEEWTGTGIDFYKSIGFSSRQMAKLIGKAKKLKREGYFESSEGFKEVHVEGYEETSNIEGTYLSTPMIELKQSSGQLIRFPQVSQLLEYVKNAG